MILLVVEMLVMQVGLFQDQKVNGVFIEYFYLVLLFILKYNQVRFGKFDVCKIDGKFGVFIVILSRLKFIDV